MNVEKLAQLDQLKANGTISIQQYNKQKRKAMKTKNWWIRIPLFVGGAFLLFHGLSSIGSSPTAPTASDLPTCDSSDAQSMLGNAITNNSSSNINTLTLLSLSNQKEVSTSNSPLERDCTAHAVLNTGPEDISYRLFFGNPNDSNSLLVQITDAD